MCFFHAWLRLFSHSRFGFDAFLSTKDLVRNVDLPASYVIYQTLGRKNCVNSQSIGKSTLILLIKFIVLVLNRLNLFQSSRVCLLVVVFQLLTPSLPGSVVGVFDVFLVQLTSVTEWKKNQIFHLLIFIVTHVITCLTHV